MNPIPELIGLFLASMAAGYLVVKILGRYRTLPLEGSKIRLRMSGGVGRTRLLGRRPGELVLGAILPAPTELPVVGECLILEAVTPHGPIIFRSHVKSIDEEPFMLVIEEPAGSHRMERRSDKRLKNPGMSVVFGGHSCEVKDLSDGGVRIVTNTAVQAGDRVYLELDGVQRAAWVLETRGGLVRLCFDGR